MPVATCTPFNWVGAVALPEVTRDMQGARNALRVGCASA